MVLWCVRVSECGLVAASTAPASCRFGLGLCVRAVAEKAESGTAWGGIAHGGMQDISTAAAAATAVAAGCGELSRSF